MTSALPTTWSRVSRRTSPQNASWRWWTRSTIASATSWNSHSIVYSTATNVIATKLQQRWRKSPSSCSGRCTITNSIWPTTSPTSTSYRCLKQHVKVTECRKEPQCGYSTSLFAVRKCPSSRLEPAFATRGANRLKVSFVHTATSQTIYWLHVPLTSSLTKQCMM